MEVDATASSKPKVMALVGEMGEAAHAGLIARSAGAEFAGALVVNASLAARALDDDVDAWLVHCSDRALEGPLSVVLDTLNDRMRVSGVPVIVTTGPDLLDAAWARLPEQAAVIMCEPSPAEEVAALAYALASDAGASGLGAHVAEDRTSREGRQLRKLSEDVDRIARVLAALTADEERDGGEQGRGDYTDVEPLLDESAMPLIRATVRARRLRDKFFPSDLFADPAWDMLLDLMAARIERKRVAVSSLCIAAAVPATTALRYLKTMTGAGLFVRRPDATDGRRVFIELSDAAAEAMARYLTLMRDTMGPAFA